MKTFAAALAVVAVSVSGSAYAQAAPAAPQLAPAQEEQYAAKLSQCFTMKSNGSDRVTLARWFVAALASAPQISDVARVEPGRKDQLDRQVAAIFTRLMATDCAQEARPLFRARSSAGIRAGGETLGRLAMQEIMGDPKSAAAMFSGYVSYLRDEDFAALAK
ncbi:hypothetical protein [Novosphingobium kaempferiae]|uniref:hypothetical protein n=1 Tax=Novosphingobium kaempferiae TaxID=2896849 RepID=UPI001E33357D|nr:hypothetical protein [Novosphingobium kaempferiae]